ncbi:MAG: MEKHLA domain-containing protein [Synechococcaceae cyanobacterium]
MSSRLAADPSPPAPDASHAAPAVGDGDRAAASWREPPWLLPPVLSRVDWILEGHQRAFGQPLLAGLAPDLSPRQRAQELFMASRLVLAHDGDDDPRLIYANRPALALWRRRWDEMLGLPSRLTAEAEHRADRALALARAFDQEALDGYGGIRVDRLGRRFRIEAARLWTLRDARGEARGQAASFSNWWWL